VFRWAFGCLIAFAAWAQAAPHTTEAVTLRKKPGEKEDAVAKLPANTPIQILAEDGRWLKVRANGAVGYLARTTIADDKPLPGGATNQWSAGRRKADTIATEMFVEVTAAKAALHADPKPDAPSVTAAAKGTHLVVVDAAAHPAWIHVRADDGKDGWIARADVDNGASTVVVAGADLKGIGLEREAFTRPPPRTLAIRTELAIGYRSLGMDFSSNGAGGLTNYLVDADAVAVTLGSEATVRRGTYVFGADGRIELSESSPGINYPGPTGPTGKIPFKTFAADAGGRAGIHFADAFEVAARGGLHYDAFLANSVDNAGMLPRERLVGVTVGVRGDVVPRHSRFSASVRFDWLAVGSRAQTPGLEDGQDSSAHAVWGGVSFRFQLDRRFALATGYDFERATTSWSGQSVRDPAVTDAHRVDTVQLVRLGLSTEL
jgi:SH3-like domain-containing protein